MLIVKFHHVVNGCNEQFFLCEGSVATVAKKELLHQNDNLLNFVISKKQTYEASISLKRKYKYTFAFRT